MAKAKVWNRNTYPYTEKFKDQDIVIQPGRYIVMDLYEAHEFRGTMSSVKLNADGQHLAQGFKMIEVEPTDDVETVTAEAEELSKTLCQACAYQATSETDLGEHIKAVHAHLEVGDPEAEAAIVKRKPGRPPKAA